MIRKINIVEAAAELAEERVKQLFTENNKGKTEEEINNLIWEEGGSFDSVVYTDEAQELFNTHYDYYFETLESCKA